MKRLHELYFITTKPGPSGDYHHVLLLNPNVAVEWMRMKAWVQDGLYGRFLGRLADVGAYGDLEGIRKYWAAQQAAETAAAEAAANATGSGAAPPDI
ncbi:hypothetical protein [Xanthomonas citri]|nr:hypothetical protein [Xanthomonas citri]QTJ30981.1 hypothetical protein XcfCFBP6167P_01035 [Xanthomonas citri pv. phaseoli var. fuscans]